MELNEEKKKVKKKTKKSQKKKRRGAPLARGCTKKSQHEGTARMKGNPTASQKKSKK